MKKIILIGATLLATTGAMLVANTNSSKVNPNSSACCTLCEGSCGQGDACPNGGDCCKK